MLTSPLVEEPVRLAAAIPRDDHFSVVRRYVQALKPLLMIADRRRLGSRPPSWNGGAGLSHVTS